MSKLAMEDLDSSTRRTLSKLLEFAKFLLSYNNLNESYKIYHCMRKMCDDTQINLDLEFMKIWIHFVKQFITAIVNQNVCLNQQNHINNNTPQKPMWYQQILELCE